MFHKEIHFSLQYPHGLLGFRNMAKNVFFFFFFQVELKWWGTVWVGDWWRVQGATPECPYGPRRRWTSWEGCAGPADALLFRVLKDCGFGSSGSALMTLASSSPNLLLISPGTPGRRHIEHSCIRIKGPLPPVRSKSSLSSQNYFQLSYDATVWCIHKWLNLLKLKKN